MRLDHIPFRTHPAILTPVAANPCADTFILGHRRLDSQTRSDRIWQLLKEGIAIPAPAVSLIPLDDRPCNRLFPQQLAAVAGCEVSLPPRQCLGWFTQPGDCDAIAAWVRDLKTERLVVSLDMLCYGGLVASRALKTDLPHALERLAALRHLRQSQPEAAIFGFNTIMRLGTTVTRAAELEDHLLLRAYSQLMDRVERLGDQEARAELAAVGEKLDPALLSDYLSVRRRNHTVNRAAIELLAEGVLDYLVLAQEDAAPIGIHIPEQMALRGQIEEFRLADRVSLCTGADEIGLVLLARQLVQAAGKPVSVSVDYAAAAGAEVIPEFEAQPLRQTVEDHISAAGVSTGAPGTADALLFVHTPIGAQLDIFEAPAAGHSPALALQADSVAERVKAAAEAGCLVGLADVAYCNGADPELISALQRANALAGLRAFAGWNTAANTTGTALTQLCLTAIAKEPNRRAAREFVLARFLDDYCYQSCVRRKVLEQAQAMGADPFHLGPVADELEPFIQAGLSPLAHGFYSALLGAGAGPPPPEVRASLPWRRLFEVEVEVVAPG